MRKCASKKRRGSKTRQRTRRLRGGNGSKSPPPAPPNRTNSASSTGSILPRIPYGTVKSPVGRYSNRPGGSSLQYPNNRSRNGSRNNSRVTRITVARTPSGGTIHNIGSDPGPDRGFGDPAKFSTSTPYPDSHKFYTGIGLEVPHNNAWTNPRNKGSAQVTARREIAELGSDPEALTKSGLVPPPGPYGVRLRKSIASIATLWSDDTRMQTILRTAVNAGDLNTKTALDDVYRGYTQKLRPADIDYLKIAAEKAAEKAAKRVTTV